MSEAEVGDFLERNLRAVSEAMGAPPRFFKRTQAKRNRLNVPSWYKKAGDDRFDEVFHSQTDLLERGEVVWAHLIQAYGILFQPGDSGLPAAVIYSSDPAVARDPAILEEAAQLLYAIKGDTDADPELQTFADTLEDGIVSPLRVPVPTKITRGVPCYYAAVFVDREHLYGEYLAGHLFPMLILPASTEASMIVPHWFWPTAFKEGFWDPVLADDPDGTRKKSPARRIVTGVTVVWLILVVIIVYQLRYSFSRTIGLYYPPKPHSLYLNEELELEIERGALGDVYYYGFRIGEFTCVLENDHGHFYLTPERSFLTKQPRQLGYMVGGIYVPNDETDVVYVWEFMMQNENRNFETPSRVRKLSKEYDQPEHLNLRDPEWYAQIPFYEIMDRPMINDDITFPRDKFTEQPLEFSEQ